MLSSCLFISSVQKEFAQERRAIKTFVENDPLLRKYFTVFLFEDIPACDRSTDDVYLTEVERCTIYVGLFGRDYGFAKSGGLSPTEREFNRATALHKSRLIFLKNSPEKERHPRIRALIRRAGRQLIRRRFESFSELTSGLYASLVDYLERTGRLRTKPFDASACPGASLLDISKEKTKWFLGQARRERQYPLRDNAPLLDALSHLNLLDSGQPTHAAVLLFGQNPQRFLISSEVKCMHFHGTEVRKPIPSYQIYRGTLFDLVDQSVDFVMSKINRVVGTRSRGPQAPVDYELPREAVAEAIVNAVAHRDYTSTASVQVMLFLDRLEIWNPGELPPALTFEKLRHPHASIPRNPLVAEPLFLARYAEKAGSGILDMIALCREAGLPLPKFRQEGGQFVQTLFRPKNPRARKAQEAQEAQEARGLSPLEISLLKACFKTARNGKEILAATSYTVRTGNFKRALKNLLSVRLIEMTLPQKPTSRQQRYQITQKGRRAFTRAIKKISGVRSVSIQKPLKSRVSLKQNFLKGENPK